MIENHILLHLYKNITVCITRMSNSNSINNRNIKSDLSGLFGAEKETFSAIFMPDYLVVTRYFLTHTHTHTHITPPIN